ncbi:hypothetical protein [Povalibacter sp.]|uniref:hypothetical protein n=1 Tax=Povalibacter sp. TaxID=1962978 RepID=UPI002F413A4F
MSARPAPRVGALPRRRRLTVYALSTAVWLTGAVWLYFKYFVRVVDDFGFENQHPQQGWWMIAHAMASVGLVWSFGVLWLGHVKPGWKKKLRRLTGGTLWGFIVWFALSGCALYYIGSEAARSWVSFLHWIPGLILLIVFLVHIRNRSDPSTAADDP